MTKPVKQDVIAIVIVGGLVVAAIDHYVNATYLSLPYPYSTFLFKRTDQFMDWFNLVRISFDPYRVHDALQPYVPSSLRGILFNPYPAFTSGRHSYFPFLCLVISIVFLLGYGPSFCFAMLSFIGFFVAYEWRPLQARSVFGTLRNVIIFTFLSYPVLFALDRANTEIWIFMLDASFLLLYRKRRYHAAATMLAISVASKPFGIVLAVLLLLDRRFVETCYAVGLAGALNLGSMLVFPGTLRENLTTWRANLGLFQIKYGLGYEGLPFGHSLFGMWKYAYFLWSPETYGFESVSHLADIYRYVAAFLLVAFCGFIFWRRQSLELWEIVGLLVVAQVVLPYVSVDYTLLHCYLPMLLFIESDKQSSLDRVTAIVFGLLMVPKQYFLLAGTEVGIGVLINPILLLSLAGIIMVRPAGAFPSGSACGRGLEPTRG